VFEFAGKKLPIECQPFFFTEAELCEESDRLLSPVPVLDTIAGMCTTEGDETVEVFTLDEE
jgi:hypothetical protein